MVGGIVRRGWGKVEGTCDASLLRGGERRKSVRLGGVDNACGESFKYAICECVLYSYHQEKGRR